MIDFGHGCVGSNHLDKALAFYDALFSPVGVAPLFEHPSGGRVYGKGGHVFFVLLAPFDHQPASIGNGSMHGFSFDTDDEVDAFYDRALTLGASDEGPPGFRAPKFYICYFRDLDGNKLCAFNFRRGQGTSG